MPTKKAAPRTAASGSLGKFVRGPFVPDEAVRFRDALWDSAVANWRLRRSLDGLEKAVEALEALDDEADAPQGENGTTQSRRPPVTDVRERWGTSLFTHWLLYSALLILRPVVVMLVAAAFFSAVLYVLVTWL